VAPPPIVPAEIGLTGSLTVGELAAKLGLGAGDIVKRLLEQGVLAGVNQQITVEAATKVTESFGSQVSKPEPAAPPPPAAAPRRHEVTRDESAVPRPPVVTIMGHVDHGKTSLLDAIRQTDVASREFGGITQHIGASTVDVGGKRIVFIDTPGHEAFTTLRARGAQITDIVVLVVAADDGVMPQTIEALNHAKAAGVPVIVAINKVDLPQSNPDRVKQQLSELGLVPEDWGGQTVTVPVSARTRQGIKELLELIVLVADLQELRANADRPARGTIIEAKLDRGRGTVATVLVHEGTLRVGDAVVAGSASGRVRAMTGDRGERLTAATPSTPVEVVGLDDVPTAGDLLEVVRDEKLAKAIAEERMERQRAAEAARLPAAGEAAVMAEGPKELRVILKADAHGSVEALVASLERPTTPEVRVAILHAAVGNVTESDIMLAAASRAVVIGFNIRPEQPVRKIAEQEHVDILSYRVIYEAIDDIAKRVRGLMAPKRREVSLGQAEVRKTFTISKVGTVAGCFVTAGAVPRSATIRVIRDGVVVHEGKISSLRRFKDDVREVTEGFECGIGLERFGDVKVGDILEAFEIREEPA
jgi:translation initiation factor IF-2